MTFRRTHKQLLASLFILLFFVPLGTALPIGSRQVHAQAVTVVGGTGTIQQTITAANTQLAAYSLQYIGYKESVLDALAWFAAKVLIKHITRSIVNWINSGFQGSPAFVTDIQGFLEDVVDIEIGKFIEGSELGFLCDPFQLQVRLALALQYNSFEEEITCRLSDIVGNVDDYLENDIRSGGWASWIQLSVYDNPSIRYIQASSELEYRINNAREAQIKELEFGNGFFSWKECIPEGSVAAEFEGAQGQFGGPSGSEPTDCSIVTPGSFIENQLSLVAGSGIRQLELADEINEIVGALAVQLISQVFNSANGGLSGLSRRQTSSGSSYLDNLVDSDEIPIGLSSGPGQILGIDSTLVLLNQHRESLSSTLTAIRVTEIYIIELAACNQTPVNNSLSTQVGPIRENLEEDLAATDRNIALLRSFQTRLSAATDTDTAQAVLDEYEALAQSGAFPTIQTVTEAQIANEGVRRDLSNLNAQLQQQLAACQSTGVGSFGL